MSVFFVRSDLLFAADSLGSCALLQGWAGTCRSAEEQKQSLSDRVQAKKTGKTYSRFKDVGEVAL